MLYTSCLDNLKNIPKEIPKLVIVRYPPDNINFDNHRSKKNREICLAKALSPQVYIIIAYQIYPDWDWYVKEFKEQMEEHQPTILYLKKLENYLKKNKDIAIICYEKNWKKCHRSLVAQEMNFRFDNQVWSKKYEKKR